MDRTPENPFDPFEGGMSYVDAAIKRGEEGAERKRLADMARDTRPDCSDVDYMSSNRRENSMTPENTGLADIAGITDDDRARALAELDAANKPATTP